MSSTSPIATPQDVPYPGVLTVDVDLTDLDRKIIAVTQSIPVKPGPMTLLYPRWIPGEHAPTAPVSQLAGLVIQAHGKPVRWVRDATEMHAFHLDVPDGASQLDVSFQHLSPVAGSDGRVIMTSEIVGLQWHSVVLYPAGHYVRDIMMRASARLPSGWQHASSLDDVSPKDGTSQRIQFKPVSLETLVDSPLWAGKYTRRVALDDTSPAPVFLTVFADAPANLEAMDAHLDAHKSLVIQGDKLFGARHFKRYEFLLAVSDHFSGIGLEHHESSENGVKASYFADWAKSSPGRDLLPHEYTHSWNGKFRRPSDLWMPNFNMPVQNSLLWVYEGQTQFWGYVLAARSGLVSLNDSLESLAITAAWLDTRTGRTWRNLQDTTSEPIITRRGWQEWSNWQRGSDYYDEGKLIWLDADTLVRELTGGTKSMNDVAKLFFGQENGRVRVMTYTFADMVAALNTLAPYDWATFLRQRLDTHQAGAPLDGLKRGGWKLVFGDKQSDYAKAVEGMRRNTDFFYSLGFSMGKEGRIGNIRWGGPAFNAGLSGSMQVIAVNSFAYKPELLREAIVQAKDGRGIELLLKFQDRYRTVKIDYRDGLRYPRLERIPDTPDRLTDLLSPL